MEEEKLHFRKNIVKQKLAYAGHVMRGSSGLNALLVLEGKFEGKKTRGRPRRSWTDDRDTCRKITHQPSNTERA